jgi:transposase
VPRSFRYSPACSGSALIRRLLLRSRFALDHASRWAVDKWLDGYPELRELYAAKESLHAIYRIRGADRAGLALTALTDRLAASTLPELQTFRRTLMRWRNEILAHSAPASPTVAPRASTTSRSS